MVMVISTNGRLSKMTVLQQIVLSSDALSNENNLIKKRGISRQMYSVVKKKNKWKKETV